MSSAQMNESWVQAQKLPGMLAGGGSLKMAFFFFFFFGKCLQYSLIFGYSFRVYDLYKFIVDRCFPSG